MDKLIKDVVKACEQYGAYTVRKAARGLIDAKVALQEGGDDAKIDLVERIRDAATRMQNIGLGSFTHKYENLLHISNIAFEHMLGTEIADESGYNLDMKGHPYANMTVEEIKKAKIY